MEEQSGYITRMMAEKIETNYTEKEGFQKGVGKIDAIAPSNPDIIYA
jgi:hypothetical protein